MNGPCSLVARLEGRYMLLSSEFRMSGRFQKEARLKRILNGDDGFKLTKSAQDALCYR